MRVLAYRLPTDAFGGLDKSIQRMLASKKEQGAAVPFNRRAPQTRDGVRLSGDEATGHQKRKIGPLLLMSPEANPPIMLRSQRARFTEVYAEPDQDVGSNPNCHWKKFCA
jgi:hypothetical protein